MTMLSVVRTSIDTIGWFSRLFGRNLTSTSLRSDITSPASTAIASYFVPSRAKHFDHHFLNRWMARDYKRRVMLKQYYPERQRLTAMKRCTVLPKEFQEVVSKELHAFPRDSCHVRTKPRCILSSRARWVIHRYRVSRIHFRLLADYNKLSGVFRGTW